MRRRVFPAADPGGRPTATAASVGNPHLVLGGKGGVVGGRAGWTLGALLQRAHKMVRQI